MIYIDQMMREVRLDKPPSRIVCMVPSITELLSELGLDDSLAGITKFCIHPDYLQKTKKRIGGTKQVHHDIIDELHPDLIIANKEENLKQDIERLETLYPVWVSDVNSLDDAVEMIRKLGELTGTNQRADEIINDILDTFSTLHPIGIHQVLYLIWRKPYMAAGTDTFVNDMLKRCGFNNVLAPGSRYPELADAEITSLHPSLILLSSEPYPFNEKHLAEIQLLAPGAKILLVDGEYFSWYGSRLTHSASYFKSTINILNSPERGTTYEN